MYVEWIDSNSPRGWQNLDHIKETAEILVCKSVGWLIAETEDCIVITAGLDNLDDNLCQNAQNPVTIPQCAITKYEEIHFGKQ